MVKTLLNRGFLSIFPESNPLNRSFSPADCWFAPKLICLLFYIDSWLVPHVWACVWNGVPQNPWFIVMFPIEVPQIQVHFGIPIFKLSKIIMMIDGYSMSHRITVASLILLVSYVHRCIVFPGHRQRATQDAIFLCFAMNCAFFPQSDRVNNVIVAPFYSICIYSIHTVKLYSQLYIYIYIYIYV